MMRNKFGKEEIQKLLLGGLLLIVLLYGYFDMLLGPLKQNRIRAKAEVETLTKQISEARGQIRRTADAEAAVPEAERVIKQVKAMIPEGAPVAWFPTHVAEHFKRQGVERAATRLIGEQPDSISGFRRMSWSVDLPKVEFVPFGQALADFENEEPLVEISTIQISAAPEDNEMLRVALNIRSTVTK